MHGMKWNSLLPDRSLKLYVQDLPVGEYLRANETFSTFLRTNCSLPPSAVDQLLRAQLSLQVVRPYTVLCSLLLLYAPDSLYKYYTIQCKIYTPPSG